MKSLNQLCIIGHVGNTPEVKELNNGHVANLNVATQTQWKDSKTGEKKVHVEWHHATLYNSYAKLAEYIKKGSRVYISGHVRTNQWEDKENNVIRERKILIANEVILLDRKKDNGHVNQE